MYYKACAYQLQNYKNILKKLRSMQCFISAICSVTVARATLCRLCSLSPVAIPFCLRPRIYRNDLP